jgi:peptidoglycan/xylan/chitin deacetylase (PgdA/CDA1 family)
MEPVVALTFDDGPDPRYTPAVLDALREAGVRATFFVIGEKALRNPELIRRMVAEGHDVQVHGYTHVFVPALTPRLTIQQVARTAQVLRDAFGIHTQWYRPTWGLCNLATLLSRTCRTHQLVTWSVMVGDWRCTPDTVLLKRILRKLHPGAIIVLHDSDETWGSERGAPNSVVALLPKLVAALRGKGYELTTLRDWWRGRR